jgi:hypothetical protein
MEEAMARGILIQGFALSLVLACGGRVSLDEVEGFGVVKSSALVKLDAAEESQVFTVLSSSTGICRKLRRAYLDYSMAYESWAETMDGGDLDAACQQRLDMYELGVDLSRGFMGGGDSLLYLSFWQEDESFILPEDGTWQLEGDGQGFYGYVNQYGSNPYEEMVSTWSNADCESDSSSIDDAVTRHWLDSGFMDVNLVGERRLKGRIEAELLDEESEPAGEIYAKIRAGSCEIEIDSDHPYFILF